MHDFRKVYVLIEANYHNATIMITRPSHLILTAALTTCAVRDRWMEIGERVKGTLRVACRTMERLSVCIVGGPIESCHCMLPGGQIRDKVVGLIPSWKN